MTSADKQDSIKGGRYKILSKIGEGGMGAVFQVVDMLNDRFVALKQVLRDAGDLEFSTLHSTAKKTTSAEQSLSNEFSILASLRHPNIVSVLDYGFDEERQAYFTMDLLESPKTITEAADILLKPEKVQLLIQLLQALDYLHLRGVIHRDLKPANVLVDDNHTVKVLDFGLALASDILQATKDDGKISGTLAYIAPEVLIGSPATTASDLYSFGVIMYEVFKGEHPFDPTDTAKLIYGIVKEIPDYSSFDDKITHILSQLLAKDPDERYGDISSLIDDLCDAGGVSRPPETLAIRESYLQAAAFIGREKEFAELEALMLQLANKGGASRLLAGESGVGKSRLLNELRVRALVEDMYVIRGQAVSEGAMPFKIWHDVLRFILLFTEIADDEARVLKSIMPDIEKILGYEVGDVPDLSPQAMQTRLIQVISEILKRQIKPMMLILEDLHWADQASIETIAYLSRNIADYQVLLLGSYRSDEMPDLPERVPDATIFDLQRFSAEQIAELGLSMPGQIGTNEEIVAFLERETAGNIFFIIEILRMWAHEAGDLRKIAAVPLPETMLAGGILAVLRKRIERLDADAQAVLIQAAIFGREIDLTLMQAVYPELDVDGWLLTASNVAILEVFEEKWRFVHDKLREYLLHELQEDSVQWKQYHRSAAETIETVYTDNERYVPALAYHYSEAEIIDKAVPYLDRAAELVRTTDYQAVVDYINKILSFSDYQTQGMQYAKWYSVLATWHYLLGDYAESEKHLQLFLRYIDATPIPGHIVQVIPGILLQIGQQFLHRIFPKQFVGTQSLPEFNHYMYTALINATVIYQHQGKMLQVIYAMLLSLNIVEHIKPHERVSPAMIYAAFTYLTGVMNLHSLAQRYYDLAQDAILPDSPPLLREQTRGLLGFYHAQRAEWQEAVPYIEACIEGFDSIGDVHDADETRNILGRIYGHRGQLAEGYRMLSESYLRAKDRRDEVIALSLYAATVSNLVHSGQYMVEDFDDLSLLINPDTMQDLLPGGWSANPAYQAGYYAIKAAYALHINEIDEAYHALEEAMSILEKRSVERTLIHFDLYVLIPQSCITMLRLENESWKADPAKDLMAWAEKSVKWLKKFAGIHTFAKPRYALLSGYVAEIKNDTKAIEHWREALRLAQDLEMPYEEAIAHAALYQATNDEAHQVEMQGLVEKTGVDSYVTRFLMMK